MHRFLFLTLVAFALAGCADEPADEEEPTPPFVAMRDFRFDPPSLTVVAGTLVTFHNYDAVQHTATADDGSFDTGPMPEHGVEQRRFRDAGTFVYHCDIHPQMTGTIHVLPASPA